MPAPGDTEADTDVRRIRIRAAPGGADIAMIGKRQVGRFTLRRLFGRCE